MYQITFCDKNISESVVFDTRYDIEQYKIFNPKVETELNKSGNLTFDVYPFHPYYNSFRKLQGIIKVYRDSSIIFRGRILEDNLKFDKSKSLYCEGDLAFLNDAIIRPYDFHGSVEDYFVKLINEYNSQVDKEKQFYVGNITVKDPNDYIYRASNTYPTAWSEINEKLLKKLGGYLIVRYVDEKAYIDYLEDFTTYCTQTIELGKNILDLNQKNNAENIATRIIALGAKLKDEEGNETDERLTIKSVNGGKDYIEDLEYIEKYGIITRTVTYDDVTIPSNLLQRAKKDLVLSKLFSNTTEISALDVSALNKDIQSFKIGLYVKVISRIHQIDEFFLISKNSIDLLNPQNNKIVVGDTKTSFTEAQSNSDNAIKSIEKNYIKNEYKENIKEQFTKVKSSINQKAEQISIEVAEKYVNKDDFNSFENDISTKYLQTNKDFNFLFEEMQRKITESDGDVQAEFRLIQKYIRFVDGHIVLGEVGNELTLEIRNDRLSFLQNNNEVAYLSNNKLYILDAQVLSSIRIGNFAFIPRKNGNLSFKWVGDK